MLFVAVANFDAARFAASHPEFNLVVADYMSFEVGDRIIERPAPKDVAPEGWAYGEHAKTQKKKWYPPNFVRRVELQRAIVCRSTSSAGRYTSKLLVIIAT